MSGKQLLQFQRFYTQMDIHILQSFYQVTETKDKKERKKKQWQNLIIVDKLEEKEDMKKPKRQPIK